MREETREMLKDNLVRINESMQFVRGKLGLTWWRRHLIRLYLASPHKLQYALARFGIRMVVNRKKADLREFVRH